MRFCSLLRFDHDSVLITIWKKIENCGPPCGEIAVWKICYRSHFESMVITIEDLE